MKCQQQQRGDNWSMISVHQMADVIRCSRAKMAVVDSRPFLEYNTSHVVDAVNVCCSKLVKRRLQDGKVFIGDLLKLTGENGKVDTDYEVYVYDQCTTDPSHLPPDCFLLVLLSHLASVCSTVRLLQGGFQEFQARHPSLVETKPQLCQSSVCPSAAGAKMVSLSQPCVSTSSGGPTRILPFLYLGSQQDALSQDTLHQCGITYVLNVSTTCPQPSHVPDERFMRVAVNDTSCEKLLPHFPAAFQFLDKIRESGDCVLVHCLAGISRSPTLAIAYVMRQLNLKHNEAYNYVKEKRQTISPNLNFVGQLLEYEKQLHQQQRNSSHDAAEQITCVQPVPQFLPASNGTNRKMPAMITFDLRRTLSTQTQSCSAPSPTTALSRLNFGPRPSPVAEESQSPCPTPSTPTTLTSSPVFLASNMPLCTPSAAVIASQPSGNTVLSLSPAAAGPHSALAATAHLHDRIVFPPVPSSSSSNGAFESSSLPVKRQSGGGIKRPASTSFGELFVSRFTLSRSPSPRSTSAEQQQQTSSPEGVKLRSSSETKTRAVRPNSIGIMSTVLPTPVQGQGHDAMDIPLTQTQSQQQPLTAFIPLSLASLLPVTATTQSASEVKWCVESAEDCDEQVKNDHPHKATAAIGIQMNSSMSRLSPIEQQARFSRSLEDVLTSPDDGSPEPKRSGSFRKRHCATRRDADGCDVVSSGSYRVKKDMRHHRSSSSISSTGSRNSLHGSLEMIEVS